jgi:hypothetical protein
MTDPIGFVFIEQDDLVCFRDGLCTADVTHVDPTVREDQTRHGDALLSALVLACPLARHVPYVHRGGHQDGVCVEVSHVDASRSSKVVVPNP